MHGQDHDGAEQDEQYVGGCLEVLHCGALPSLIARMGGIKAMSVPETVAVLNH
jgi:hypothetical protein